MSAAGSEFALRIALCDLVERLKRSEQMCKYLERCRNELAKELIRVKQENQIISRENSMMAASLENQTFGVPMTRNKSPRPLNVGTSSVTGLGSGGDRNESPNGSGQEEILDKSTDWEEITARLLNQLRKEVELMAPKGVASSSSVIPLEGEDQRNKSVGSVFVLPVSSTSPPSNSSPSNSSPREKKCASVKEESTSSTMTMKVRGESEDGMVVSGSPSSSKFGTVEEATKDRVEVVPGRRPLSNHSESLGSERGRGEEREEERGEERGTFDAPRLAHSSTPDLMWYVRLVQDLTSDLNKFSDQVSVQNEKLTRIKSKQLRCYFKRQLNKPSEKKDSSGGRSGSKGESDQYQRRQQHQNPKPGLAEFV